MKKKDEKTIIFFCNGKKCGKYNKEPKDYLKKQIVEFGLEDKVCVSKMDCQGMCKKAPVLCIQPKDIWKKEVSVKKAKKLFEKHIL
jgi:(2Fe-2S) ferredoxin